MVYGFKCGAQHLLPKGNSLVDLEQLVPVMREALGHNIRLISLHYRKISI